MRRVKAMIENLIETLPDQREPVLHQELRILASSAKRGFAESDDQKLADTSDLQGLGGSNTEKQKTQVQPHTSAG